MPRKLFVLLQSYCKVILIILTKVIVLTSINTTLSVIILYLLSLLHASKSDST